MWLGRIGYTQLEGDATADLELSGGILCQLYIYTDRFDWITFLKLFCLLEFALFMSLIFSYYKSLEMRSKLHKLEIFFT